ncbi:MAG TPA: FHA domain-containing protein [Chloroflexaceae bacterium]|nr:FHA domain-containing protein [Chloroflexaceae bacterium]
MITCWHCATSLLDGTIFCDSCGAALLDGAPRRVAPPLPPAHPRSPKVRVADSARLVLVEAGVALPLPPAPLVVLGRTSEGFPPPDVDLGPFQAAAAGVSRAHVALDLAGPRPRIEDLGSTNGTYVNGRRISPRSPVPLALGDQISLGRLALRLEL